MPRILLSLLVLFGAAFACAAAGAEPSRVQITFIPPPMEGTISLGVYNEEGKLVRVLKTEAEEKDFTVGLNGLITFWDGRDDVGQIAKAGRYQVRGFSVGALEVEGVAYYCNDWITDDESARVRRVLSAGRFIEPGKVELPVELSGDKLGSVMITYDAGSGSTATRFIAEPPPTPAVIHLPLPAGADQRTRISETVYAFGPGKVWRKDPAEWTLLPMQDLERPIALGGGGETLWVVDGKADGTLVCEFSKSGELLRALPTEPGEPEPKWVAAHGRDELLLVDQAQDVERVRLLRREKVADEGTGRLVSTWRTITNNTIRRAPSLEAVIPHVPRLQTFKPEARVQVRLVPNPLLKDAAVNVSVEIGKDANGAVLKTGDGLPLIRLTDALDLKWVAMGRETGSKAVTILQYDGAVVEEFRAGKLANMMSFDAGAYDWAGQ